MRTLAIVLALALAAAAEDKSELHVYSVGALTVRIENFPGPALGFDASGNGSDWSGGEEEGVAIAGEDLKLLISQTIAPGTWDTPPNSIEYMDGQLIVRHAPEAHVQIRAFLDALRSQICRTVVVETEVLLLAPGVLDAPAGSVLTDAQLKAVDEAASDAARGRRIASLRACGLNGQRFHAKAVGQETFLREFDVEIAERSAIADPVMGLRSAGYLMDVRPTLSEDGRMAFLAVRFAAAEPRALRTFEPGGKTLGTIEQPDDAVARTRTNLVVPVGRWAILSATSFGGAQPGWTQVVLVRPGVDAGTPVALPVPAARIQARLFDTRFILCRAEDFAGPRLGGTLEVADEGVGAVFMDAEEGVSVSGDQLIGMIRRGIAPDSWDQGGVVLTTNGELLVLQTAENLKLVEQFLARLVADRSRLVSVDSWVLAFDEAAWRERREAISGDLTDAAWKDVLSTAARGGAVRIVGTAGGAGLNGARFHAAQGVTRAVVLDYDVEVAQSASAVDPIMTPVVEGICLDVLPASVGNGGQVQLDLRPTTVLGGEPRAFPMQDKGVQVQAVELADFGVRTQMLVDAGKPTLVGVAMRPKAGGSEVLVLVVRATVIDVK
ncbi:MAG: hypothetical protein IT452_05955 [Planctomycetia bacterium]|nr:hypothetical protein [Planctomycetia bacterium]